MYRRSTRPFLISIVFAAVICPLLLACDSTDKKPSAPPEKITIAYSATPDAGLAEVAQMKGYYLQEGLDAVAKKYPLGKFALQSVLDGTADFATVAETPFALAVMNGQKLSIIATIQTSKGNHVLIADKDKGILSPEDLIGKKIAATLGTSGEYFLDAFLVSRGISRKGITIVDLKPDESRDKLISGAVDAILALPSVVVQVQGKMGDRAIIFDDKDIFTQFFIIAAKQDFIQKNPDKVRKLLRALVRAEEFIKQKPAEAQKIVAEFIGQDEASLGKIWAVNDFNVTLSQSMLLALEDLSRWAIRNRHTKARAVPDYLSIIYFDGLKSVKPEAVRILR